MFNVHPEHFCAQITKDREHIKNLVSVSLTMILMEMVPNSAAIAVSYQFTSPVTFSQFHLVGNNSYNWKMSTSVKDMKHLLFWHSDGAHLLQEEKLPLRALPLASSDFTTNSLLVVYTLFILTPKVILYPLLNLLSFHVPELIYFLVLCMNCIFYVFVNILFYI